MSVFSFVHESLSKYQWIFTKLGMCKDIVEIWFVIANGQIFVNLLCACPMTVVRYYRYILLLQEKMTWNYMWIRGQFYFLEKK